MATAIDYQWNSSNLTNSVVFGRNSTNSDIGSMIFADDLNFENEIYIEVEPTDYELVCLIGEMGWNDVYVDNDGNEI